jgi:hypothetical protein
MNGASPTDILVSSVFEGGTENIKTVKVYCSEADTTNIVVTPMASNPGTASAPGGARVSNPGGVEPVTLQAADEKFVNTGLSNLEIGGLEPGKLYNIVIEITNVHDDTDAISFTHPAGNASLEVSVPVKMIFAAFRSDGGKITSPVYRIKTSAYFPIKVSLAKFASMNSDASALTQVMDDDLELGQFNLKLVGVSSDEGDEPEFAAAADTGWIGTADMGTPGGVLGTFGSSYSSSIVHNQCGFKLTGLYKYEGDFPETPMRPEYAAVFKFEIDIAPQQP